MLNWKMVDTSHGGSPTRCRIHRSILLPEQATSDLAVLATKRALKIRPGAEELDLVIVLQYWGSFPSLPGSGQDWSS